MTASELITLKKRRITIALKTQIELTFTPSDTSIGDLPDDVLVEIICKLPIKQMTCCKCISKLWELLISNVCVPRVTSNPVYAVLFNTVLSPPAGERGEWSITRVTSSNDQHTRETSLEKSCLGTALPFHPSPDALLDCCNGLLLYFDKASTQYYLCNPSTQETIVIPNSPGNQVYKTAALIFDSHYKIVNMGGIPAIMNIFSLVTREWSVHNLGSDIFSHGSFWSPRYIYLDGSIYRLCVSGYVLRLVLNPVGCRRISLPSIVKRCLPIGCLGVSQGVLHYGWDNLYSKMMVWILKTGRDCEEEWVLKYTLCMDYFKKHPTSSDVCDIFSITVLAFHPTADKLVVGNSFGMFCYDPHTKELVVICVLSSGRRLYSGQFLVYLFSPNITRLEALSQRTIKDSAGCVVIL